MALRNYLATEIALDHADGLISRRDALQKLGLEFEVVVPGVELPAGGTLDSITTRVAGGRLLTSSLVSVLVTDDGTLYAGAVRGEDLQRVAATGTGL